MIAASKQRKELPSSTIPKKRGRPPADRAPIDLGQVKSPDVTVDKNADDVWLSPNDIGKILNVTGEAVKQWIYRRKLPAVKLRNGYWKIRKVDFDAYLKNKDEDVRRLVIAFAGAELGDVEAQLKALGHRYLKANNVPDGLIKARNEKPSLFVISLDNAELWSLAKRLRGMKELKHAPILLLSPKKLTDAEADRVVELDACGILEAPYTGEQVSAEMARALRI